MSDTVYSKPVLDFVTVSVEFCAFLEKNDPMPRHEWLTRLTRLLPMLYLKALLLPEVVTASDDAPENFVREEDYMRVAGQIAAVMGEEDAYLDVFVEDMKYSDTPVSAFVSENIADIYQDVRNFVSVYQYELTEQMQDALAAYIENFRAYWGQKLVNVLRPMHALLYAETQADADDFNPEETTGGFWE